MICGSKKTLNGYIVQLCKRQGVLTTCLFSVGERRGTLEVKKVGKKRI